MSMFNTKYTRFHWGKRVSICFNII